MRASTRGLQCDSRPIRRSTGTSSRLKSMASEWACMIHGTDARRHTATATCARTKPGLPTPAAQGDPRIGQQVEGQGAADYLRQREYPHPPPPSTNSTTRMINKVSMSHHLPRRCSPECKSLTLRRNDLAPSSTRY